MNRSWISLGRRPNGLCGAAILIAARMHGFRRTPEQIVKVVHVCDETLRKRIGEFKTIKTAALSFKQFKEIADKEKDPKKFNYEDQHYEPP